MEFYCGLDGPVERIAREDGSGCADEHSRERDCNGE